MTEFQTLLNKMLDTFFHLPTLISLAVIGLVVIWQLYDLGVDVGDGFIRLNSNQGHLNLYWLNGCCRLAW